MEFLSQMLSFGFMQRALVAAVLLGLLGALVSFFVVVRQLSFLGVGVAHAAFGGAAIGVLAGWNPVAVAGIFGTAVAWGVGWVARRSRMHEDAAIGILFSASMALGIALLSLSPRYVPDAMGLLFGTIAAVSWGDVVALGAITLGVLAFYAWQFPRLLTAAFDEELAAADGIPVGPLYFGLITAVGLTVVVAVKVVGVVLGSALLVIPAATGYQLSSNFRGILAIALVTGLVSTVGGLVLSYALDLPSGAVIVLLGALQFGLAVAARSLRRPGRRGGPGVQTASLRAS